MVKHEDENSSSSTDSSSSSFASSCKSEKLKSVTKKETLNLSKSTPASSSTLSSSLTTPEPGYNSNTNPLFKLNPTNSSFNSHSTGAANLSNTQLQNLVKMRGSTASKSVSNSNEHSFLGAAGVTSNHFKQTMNTMHLMSSKHLEKDRDKAGISSNCSTSSSSSNSSFNNGNVNHTGEIVVVEETVRKREMRLLKNREAARECRRKKKEYIKCLENRVAVLENQNKTLIDELKSLKELYCQNGDTPH